MISLASIQTLGTALKEKISATAVLYAVREEHLQKKLGGRSGTFLAIVLPSATGIGTSDSAADLNTIMMLVLKDAPKSQNTDSKELTEYATLQTKAAAIKDEVIRRCREQVSPLSFLDIGTIETDPVWNIAGNYIGYSITFNFTDDVR